MRGGVRAHRPRRDERSKRQVEPLGWGARRLARRVRKGPARHPGAHPPLEPPMNAPVKPVFASSSRVSVTVKTGLRAGRALEEGQKRG